MLEVLPHLDRLDRQSAILALSPSRQPRGRSVPKCPLSVLGVIDPRFIIHMVTNQLAITVETQGKRWRDLRKPSVGATNGKVENEVEPLVERSVTGGRVGLHPWVRQQSTVFSLLSKIAHLVEGLVLLEADKLNLMHATVDVKVDVVGRPLHAVGMITLGIVATTDALRWSFSKRRPSRR